VALAPFLVSSPPERVDLATNGSSQPITAHVVLDLRHIDTRGNMRVMKLKFGILQGLRFDIVVGLYAISTHLVDVMKDLLAVQLEYLESGTPKHVSLLHGEAPHMLMMSSREEADNHEMPELMSGDDSDDDHNCERARNSRWPPTKPLS
jgi:hypothetical protein